MLVRIIKNWDSPDLLRQTPFSSGVWNDIRFTCEEVIDCDAVIVLNYLKYDVRVNCPAGNVFAVMQEPFIPGIFDWMVEGHDQFSKVYTHQMDVKGGAHQYVRSQPALPWHVNRSYDQLKNVGIPEKVNDLSWITSNQSVFPGHRRRMSFLEFIMRSSLKPHIFGKGINFIYDKWDGLASYRYSLAIENSSGPDYWTEKIADCFLAGTLPFYYGCTNLEEYFPTNSFIRIDIEKPDEAIRIIERSIKDNEWEKRKESILSAKELVLNKLQFFPYFSDELKKTPRIEHKTTIDLRAYRPTPRQYSKPTFYRRVIKKIFG